MADTIYYRFVLRRGLASEWVTLNEIILEGEFGLELDTGKLKMGDGTTAWNSLDYIDSAIALSLLSDVDTTGRTDGESLTWDAAAQKHVYTAITGGGDVTGAASSTDNSLPRFDGTTGKLLQTSGVVLDDTDNVTGFRSEIIRPNGASTYGFKLTGRQVSGVAVPYFVPETATTPIAFDIFPKGAPSNFSANTGVAWIDVCSTDIEADGTNYEALRLGVLSGGDAHVSHAKGGTGTQRNLRLQINGGKVGIGSANTPTSTLTVNDTSIPALALQVSTVDKFYFAQATANGNWFTNSTSGAHCIRGTGGAILMGTNASTPNYTFGMTSAGAIYNPTHSTTASAANMFIDSSTGQISRSTSSKMFKTNIKSVEDVTDVLMKLRPVTYTSKCLGDDPKEVMFGLIAEEVAKVCPELASFDRRGRPNGVQYERLAVLLLKAFQDLKR